MANRTSANAEVSTPHGKRGRHADDQADFLVSHATTLTLAGPALPRAGAAAVSACLGVCCEMPASWTEIADRVFGQMTALRSHRQLTHLPDGMRHLTALAELHLDDNCLEWLPASVTGHAQRSPESPLRFARPGPIEDIADHAEAGPKSLGSATRQVATALTMLSCAHNRLTTLPDTVGGLVALRTLNVSSNGLTELYTRLCGPVEHADRARSTPQCVARVARKHGPNACATHLGRGSEPSGAVARHHGRAGTPGVYRCGRQPTIGWLHSA